MNTYAQINDRLKEMLPQLPPALQVVSKYMLEHPGDIATLSTRKVAGNAGVSLPNFARIAKALGYETYGELRDVYRKQVQQNNISDYHLRAENLQGTDGDNTARELWEKLHETTISNLSSLFASIDPDYFSSVAKILNESRTIFLVGMQASANYSAYTHYIGGMASDKFRLLRGEGGVFADSIVNIDKGDAMIVISHQPCARVSIELATIARERGAIVVALTDSPASPAALEADHVFIAPNHGPMFFESYVSSTALVEALVGFFAMGQPDETMKRIKLIEADRERISEYWKPRKA